MPEMLTSRAPSAIFIEVLDQRSKKDKNTPR